MADNIIFEFEKEGESIILDGSPFGILDYSGLEATDYNLNLQANVNGDGEILKRKSILSREIMVEFDYLDWNISQMRQKLIRFFSPYSPGTLYVTYLDVKRRIEYEVSSFRINSKNMYEELSCLVYIRCLDPSFKSEDNLGALITTLIGGWKWPFTLPFKMKQYGPLKKNIFNRGYMPAPIEIHFKGPAVNPKIINHRTGEYVRVKKELTSDDTLYINTAFRQKKVEIIKDGVRESAWDYLDLSSSFFWLRPGDNMIEYSTDSGISNGVEIFYRERYPGI